MTLRDKMVEVGDLFVTEAELTLKLLPSKKSGSRAIRWFNKGQVTNVRLAAKDIAYLVGRLQGRRRVVRALTIMTDGGPRSNIGHSGLIAAVQKAGFSVLK